MSPATYRRVAGVRAVSHGGSVRLSVVGAGTLARLVTRFRRSVPGFRRPTSRADAAYLTVASSILGLSGAALFSAWESGFGGAIVGGFFCVFVLGPLAFARRVWFVTPVTVSAVLGFVAIRSIQAGHEDVALGGVLGALCWTAAATALAVRSVDDSVVEPDASPK